MDNRLDYLAGQVSGLMTFVAAIIKIHPDPGLLQMAITRATESQIAKSLPVAVREEFLQGQQDTYSDLINLIASRVAEKRT